MARYRFTNKAIDDLNQIWDYTCEQWSDAQDLKGYKIGRHIIFYRKEEMNELTVIRILHDKMNLKRRIKE